MGYIEEGGRYINPNDKLIIWKYLDFWKFKSMIEEEMLYLTRVDSFENYSEAVLSISDQQYFEKGNFPGIRDFVESTKEKTYINCFCQNDRELIRMWENYTDNLDGVAIRTTVSKLKDVLRASTTEANLHLAQVEYFDPISDALGDLNTIRIYARKITDYNYEREIRIITQLFEQKQFPEAIKVKINLEDLIEELVLGPNLSVENRAYINKRFLEKGMQDICRDSFIPFKT